MTQKKSNVIQKHYRIWI